MWQLGPYRVEGLIARGGMGEILRAYDLRHDRVVALKVLAAHLAADQEFRERFKREAHAVARLREPHVIPIHAYGEIDGRLYLDMRLVEGSDVASLLDSGGPMSPARTVDVIEQVAQALDAAHGEGLVHRDVKPSNILVSTEGFAYLVDFGIAHSASIGATLTATGATIGTLDYMAPERFDDAPVDARADVYSLACVLYQCLTGAKPFSGDTAASLINAHLHYQPPLPTASFGGIPRQFDEIIARGMAKDPARRFASAGELARSARQALTSSVPAHAGALPSTSPRRRGKVARWGFVVSGVCVVAGVAVAALVATQPAVESSPPMGKRPNVAPPPSLGEMPQPGPKGSSGRAPASASDPSAKPPPAVSTKVCQPVSFAGVERGFGCFDPAGDHLSAQDTVADGMWIRVDSMTDYGRRDECKDLKSEGGPVDCTLNVSEKGRLRFQVQLWDAKTRITEGGWTDYLPAGR
jgi:serine/threonine-protein kinase